MLFLYSFVMLSCTSVDALWSAVGKGPTPWLSFVMSYCDVVTLIGILGRVWCLIVSILDLCPFSIF